MLCLLCYVYSRFARAMTLAELSVMSGAMPQVLECILSHLSVGDVCRLSSVCKKWHNVALSSQLWKHLCEQGPVNLQQLIHAIPQGQRPCYKSMYKAYVVTLKKWTTGEGVTTLSKTLQTANGQDFSGRCLLMSDRYIFAIGRGGADHNITVFSASTGQYAHQLTGLPARSLVDPYPFDYMRLSEDGMKAAAYCGTVACVWDVQSGERMHTLQHGAKICTMQMHHGLLAVGLAASCGVWVWNMESGHQLRQLNDGGVEYADVLAIDAHHVAVHERFAYVVQLWDVNTGTHLFTWTSYTMHVMLLDAGTNSLVGCPSCADGRFTVWDTNTGMRKYMIHANPGQENCHAGQLIHHEGKLVIAYNREAGMRSFEVVDLVNYVDAEIPASVNVSPRGPLCVGRIPVLSNGLLIGYGASDHSIDVWDMSKRRFIRSIHVRDGPGEQGEHMAGVHAVINQLQVVLQQNDKLTYIKYDFGP